MKKITYLQSLMLALGVTLLVALGLILYILRDTLAEGSTLLATPLGSVMTEGTSTIPLRLRIVALQVDAKIQQVGRTSAGLMGIPSNFTDVAWYKLGPQPGGTGSAVIAGHLDNALALSGVFKHLGDLRIGDEVDVDTAAAGTIRFRVIRIAVYPYDQVPLDELFKKNDGAYLNLVTCAGVWLKSKKTYDQRLIVYTARIPEGTAN